MDSLLRMADCQGQSKLNHKFYHLENACSSFVRVHSAAPQDTLRNFPSTNNKTLKANCTKTGLQIMQSLGILCSNSFTLPGRLCGQLEQKIFSLPATCVKVIKHLLPQKIATGNGNPLGSTLETTSEASLPSQRQNVRLISSKPTNKLTKYCMNVKMLGKNLVHHWHRPPAKCMRSSSALRCKKKTTTAQLH